MQNLGTRDEILILVMFWFLPVVSLYSEKHWSIMFESLSPFGEQTGRTHWPKYNTVTNMLLSDKNLADCYLLFFIYLHSTWETIQSEMSRLNSDSILASQVAIKLSAMTAQISTVKLEALTHWLLPSEANSSSDYSLWAPRLAYIW